jgi:hypothetical protein
VRATGAVIPPLIILFVALWGVRIPSPTASSTRGARCDLVELSARLAGVDAPVERLLRFGNWRNARMLGPAPAALPATAAAE